MYSFSKSYTLIAQTPLIHFQHDQSGHTLRATEVKPKLDKFLIKLYKESHTEDSKVPNEWFNKIAVEGTQALDYKMRIITHEPKEKRTLSTLRRDRYGQLMYDELGNPKLESTDEYKLSFFGNTGKNKSPNYGQVRYKEIIFADCTLEITCFNEDLRNFIDKNINAFFIRHNFGTRQTKGFGSYLVEGTTDIEIDNAINSTKFPYLTATDTGANNDHVPLMQDAMVVYTCMKTGYNLGTNRYIKGYAMRDYLDTLVGKPGSDKAFMKQRIVTAQIHEQHTEQTYPEHTFIRAVLGLADHYEFRDKYRNNGCRDKYGNIQYDSKGEIRYNPATVEISKKIDDRNTVKIRFASPVIFKIFPERNMFYLMFDDTYKKILKTTFKLYCKHQNEKSVNSWGEISTPASFDPADFLKNFAKWFENEKFKLRKFAAPYNRAANIKLDFHEGGSNQ